MCIKGIKNSKQNAQLGQENKFGLSWKFTKKCFVQWESSTAKQFLHEWTLPTVILYPALFSSHGVFV